MSSLWIIYSCSDSCYYILLLWTQVICTICWYFPYLTKAGAMQFSISWASNCYYYSWLGYDTFFIFSSLDSTVSNYLKSSYSQPILFPLVFFLFFSLLFLGFDRVRRSRRYLDFFREFRRTFWFCSKNTRSSISHSSKVLFRNRICQNCMFDIFLDYFFYLYHYHLSLCLSLLLLS